MLEFVTIFEIPMSTEKIRSILNHTEKTMFVYNNLEVTYDPGHRWITIAIPHNFKGYVPGSLLFRGYIDPVSPNSNLKTNVIYVDDETDLSKFALWLHPY